MRFSCRIKLHRWNTVRDTGKHLYQECLHCKKRQIKDLGWSVYQPIEREWLKGGRI